MFTFIDLFSGIGGIRLGFEHVGGKCVFSSDIDKYARQTYKANFGEEPAGDITTIQPHDIPSFDVLTAGFPCQPFSVAGLRKGFEDTRGTLFFNICEIIEHHQPKVVFLENVKGLTNHAHGNTLKIIKQNLVNLGYSVNIKVLNAKDFGIPQNRERLFIVGFKNQNISFTFPTKTNIFTPLSRIIDNTVSDKYFYTEKSRITSTLRQHIVNENTVYQWRRKYVRENKNGICPTLTANMGQGGHNVPIIRVNNLIRKITPRECARLQGFDDTFKIVVSDTQAYKQFGNSVCVSVIKALAEKINEVLTCQDHTTHKKNT